jgi:acyl-CoA thioesterase FadM
VSGFVARWPVLQQHRVTSRDVDAEGNVQESTLQRWAIDACSEYLDRCDSLQRLRTDSGLHLACRLSGATPGNALGRPAVVAVSAGVTEVRPRGFTIALRLRAFGADPATLSARCVVRLEDPATGEPQELGDAVRQELVALQHSATHLN